MLKRKRRKRLEIFWIKVDADELRTEEYDIKIKTPKIKGHQPSPKKSRFSKNHIDGKCSHIFQSGKNSGLYCNTKVIEGSEFCRIHDERTSATNCHGKTKDGKICKRLASKQIKGKGFCPRHYTEKIEKQREKEAAQFSDSEKPKKYSSKLKPKASTLCISSDSD